MGVVRGCGKPAVGNDDGGRQQRTAPSTTDSANNRRRKLNPSAAGGLGCYQRRVPHPCAAMMEVGGSIKKVFRQMMGINLVLDPTMCNTERHYSLHMELLIQVN